MGAQLGDETRQPKTRQRRRGRISVEPGLRDLTGWDAVSAAHARSR